MKSMVHQTNFIERENRIFLKISQETVGRQPESGTKENQV